LLHAAFAALPSGAKNNQPDPAWDSASFNPFQSLSTIKKEKCMDDQASKTKLLCARCLVKDIPRLFTAELFLSPPFPV